MGRRSFLWTIVVLAVEFTLTIRALSVGSSLHRKVVLITGCSSGIGKSTAEEFLRHSNFKVWATMRNPAVSTIMPTDDNRLSVASMDVSSDESVLGVVKQIIDQDGRIDVVINNAGYGLAGCLETVELEEAKRLFEVNVWGPVRVLQAVLPFMRLHRTGHIINISSTSGLRGIPCMEFYTGSKFALEGIMDSLRYSLATYNISVTNVNAGPVKTLFAEKLRAADSGQRGSRELQDESCDYLHVLTSGMIAGLDSRTRSEDGQTSDELARVLVNLVNLKLHSRRVTDVPFNVGSNFDSQDIIQKVRRHPTGWGGIYNDILQTMPSLEATRELLQRSAGHEDSL